MTPAGFLSFDSTAVALVAGAAMFISLLSVMRALAPSDGVAARARSHARRRNELRAAVLADRGSRRRKSVGLAKRLVESLKLHRSKEADDASSQLVRAGWRSADATTLFLAIRLASPPLLGLVTYFLVPNLLPDLASTSRQLAGLGGIIAGAYLPKILLRNFIQRRQRKVLKALPEALDLLVICADAGLSLDAAIKRVGGEIGPSSPELADELGLVAIELSFLPNRREALGNFSKRVPIAQTEALVNTLAQTERYGTPLAQALRVLSQDFRAGRMMRAEQKAARLPAIMTVPMMTFILPPLFVVLVGPAIVEALSTSF